jgi:hypothetical protein
MTAELSKKIDNHPPCILCGEMMELIFFLKSPDTRAE